uniref:Fibrinogen C-terminal domain-containing protein n=1 Tax=Erpetoichthys calabaricus TaxID=27687 RepID=A0A8C4T5L6_ERPCA
MWRPAVLALLLFLFIGKLYCDSGEAKKTQKGAAATNEASDQHRPSSEAHSQPAAPTGKCSYTFVVPQQKITGAICLSSKSLMSEDISGLNKTELANLRLELGEQQRQIEHIKQMVEVDGGIVNEVKLLRKESRNMNSRITQLYTQLLHEIIQKKEQSLEETQLENRLLNITAQVLKVSASNQELERKYGAMISLINNQSLAIARLEKQCLVNANGGQPQQAHPGQAESKNKSNSQADTSNEIQRDQTATLTDKQPQRGHQAIQPPPTSAASSPTESYIFHASVTKTAGPWKDCQHALEDGQTTSGIYLIRPRNVNQLLQVWCEQSYQNGGWAVIQKRQDGSVNFFRTWEHYKQGFGNIDGEYWLGLDSIHWLTTQDDYRLLVLLEDWNGRQVYAEYDSFRVENEREQYRLRLGHYQGTAGDSLSWHNNKAFTTLDRDHDAYTGNCAHFQKGGWWYHTCAHSNLNGVWYKGGHYRSRYQDGVYWAEFRGGSYSLRKVTMMIRRA